MNKSVRGASLVLLALSPFAYLACSDDNDGTGGTITNPTVDAATSVADAAPVDAASEPDAGDDAAVATTATVIALNTRKLPEAGVKVVFYDAAGALLGTETTNAAGTATHTLPTGGAITAVFGTSSDHELVTILGVEPGDTLTVLDPLRPSGTTVAVTPPNVANVPLPAGTATFRIDFGRCSTGTFATTGGPVVVNPSGCSDSDAPGLVLVALGANDTVLARTAAAGVAIVPNGSTPVTFAGPWITTFPSDTASASNLPTTGVSVLLTHSSGTGTGVLTAENSPSLANGAFTQASPRLFPGATFVQDEVDTFLYSSAPFALVTRAIVTRGAPGPTTTDFATALPAITKASVTGTTAPTLTWTSASPLTGTKGLVAQLYWNDGPSESFGAWLVIAPPTLTTIAPPALPTDLAQSGPVSTAVYETAPLMAAVDGTFLPSYATVRASAALLTPNRSLRIGNFDSVVSVLPVDGTLKLTAYGQNND